MNEQIAAELVKRGYQVTFLVSGFARGESKSTISGYQVIRLGSRWTVYWQAFRYYRTRLQNQTDIVIDEINTVPFFAKFYVRQPTLIVIYQLCRQIWFYQLFFPLNAIGYALEPLYLRLLKDRVVATESESTKKELQRLGFKAEKVHVFPVSLEETKFSTDLAQTNKFSEPTLLYLGSLRAMKRPDHVIKAFLQAKKSLPNLKLIIAGAADDRYGQALTEQLSKMQRESGIQYLGRISSEQRAKLLGQVHLICVTSVKEGWGLVVTEANRAGTPAIVYDVDGLRDSVRHDITGIICDENTPDALAHEIVKLVNDSEKYERFCKEAHGWSKQLTIERTVDAFEKALEVAAK